MVLLIVKEAVTRGREALLLSHPVLRGTPANHRSTRPKALQLLDTRTALEAQGAAGRQPLGRLASLGSSPQSGLRDFFTSALFYF